MHKRARRPRLSCGIPARPARAVRGRVLARGPALAAAHARGGGRVRPGARVRRRARCATRCCSSARRSRSGGPGRPATRRSPIASPTSSARPASPCRGRRSGRARSTGRRGSRPSSACGPGLSSRRIVVLAHRDSLDSPGLADLSGTAALLELARIFRTRAPTGERDVGEPGKPQLIGRDLRKTLVLVSTSGGSGGAGRRARVGARAGRGRDRRRARARRPRLGRWRKPWVVPWSNGRDQPPLGWQRTVEAAVRQEVGADPGGARASAQWARRALPLAVTEQGEVNRAGPARRAAAGQRRARAGRGRARLARALHGARARRAAQRDRARRGRPRATPAATTRPPFAGEPDGIVTLRNVLPDWSVRLLVLCLLLPALLAALDSFFRARRRRLRTGAWIAWALAAGRRRPARVGLAARARDRGRAAGPARARRRRPTCGSRRARPPRSRRSRWPSWPGCCSCGR